MPTRLPCMKTPDESKKLNQFGISSEKMIERQ